MSAVSELYREHIYSQGQITRVQVTYNLSALDSKEGGVFLTPAGNEFSRPEQAMNEIRAIGGPITTLEPGYWRLDGSFMLPRPPEQSNMEVVFWIDQMSGVSVKEWNYRLDGSWRLGEKPFAELDSCGTFEEPLIIEREFVNVQTFNALGITFDTATNNYCTDFEVFMYNAFGGLVCSEHIKDSTKAYRRTQRASHDILRVVIKLNKTNRPFRYARVTEIDFGIVLLYGGDVIQKIRMIRETALSGKSFPLPEMRLRILNKGLYDQLDSSTYAPYFQTRQRFEYNHGLELPGGSIE